jgi:hypothetical protein
VARIDDLFTAALKTLPSKPADNASRSAKSRYSELVSKVTAQAFAEELRARGMKTARPAPPGVAGASGAERRMAGGIGAKKVDVTWATEESGLIFAVSIKSINWRDARSGNFQKNLTNRRGDMLFEGVTLHRRFPYAILAGFFLLDKESATDGTEKRSSTFVNAHKRLRMFTGRTDPAGRDEQFERLLLLLLDANPFQPKYSVYAVGNPDEEISLDRAFDDLIAIIAERNPDFYQTTDGGLERAD